jgi:hypothetical protein
MRQAAEGGDPDARERHGAARAPAVGSRGSSSLAGHERGNNGSAAGAGSEGRQAEAAEIHLNTALRKSIAVRTFNDWDDPPPGFFEMDLVAHCGGSVAGSHVHSLVLTDIASGWTEAAALVVREQTLITITVEEVRGKLPFPMLGLDVDNDSAFINETVVDYCKERKITLTRSRAYKKNDQAWIEQKNGSVVRGLVGYGRLEGAAAAEALGKLHEAARLYVNYFQPSFKLNRRSEKARRS